MSGTEYEDALIVRLDGALRQFAKAADAWFKERAYLLKRHEFYQAFFTRENLLTVEWEGFQELGHQIHALSNHLARAKAFGKQNYEDINRYRTTFERLARGPGSPADKIRWFLNNPDATQRYIGSSTVTEIVAQLNAETHVPFNERSRQAATFLGLPFTPLPKDDVAVRFEKFSMAVRPLFPLYEKIVTSRTTLPVGAEVDQFLSWVFEQHVEPGQKQAGAGNGDGKSDSAGDRPTGTKAAPATRSAHFPLNQILHGPPGCGKTYRSLRLAIAICDGTGLDLDMSDAAVRKRIDELRAADRLGFTTFHQSTTYEDFVEGIRVSVVDGQPVYEVRHGLFRRMCEAAGMPATPSGRPLIRDEPIWKMSLGSTQDPADVEIYHQCIAAGRIALGYGHGLDFTGCDTRGEVAKRLQEHDNSIKDLDYHVTAVNTFKNKMEPGDIVVVSDGNYAFRAIGRVSGGYEPPQGKRPAKGGVEAIINWQRRPVKWLWHTSGESLDSKKINSKIFSQMCIYGLDRGTLDLPAINNLVVGEDVAPALPHVLIIDEINRGNIARILGELITLIEPPRRIGQAQETRSTLTYSQVEAFGVPDNLFLIGTMNTSDRSIAFLDSALRRRFHFEAVLPDIELVRTKVGDIDGVSPADILEAINTRVAVLLGDDHQVGHSYLLGVKSLSGLRDVLVGQVIPLLRELFPGDDLRWCQVFRCPFDRDTGEQANVDPVLLAEPVQLGAGDEPRVRVRVNPEFVSAVGEELRPFLTGLYR